MLKKILTVLIVLTAVAVPLASLKVYAVSSASGGDLFWNAKEAYLFVGITTRGCSVSYLQFLPKVLMEFLGHVSLPDDTRNSGVVLRITSEIVQRFEVEDMAFGPFQLFQNVSAHLKTRFFDRAPGQKIGTYIS